MNSLSTLRRGAVAALMLAGLACLAGPAARAETNSAAPGDTKSVTAPKPASEEKPTGNGTPSTQASPAQPSTAQTTAAQPKPEAKKRTKAEVEAFLAKCSQEADEKGLDVKKGKGAERKAFRRECMKKFGVEAK